MGVIQLFEEDYDRMREEIQELRSQKWELCHAINYIYMIVSVSETFRDIELDLDMKRVILDPVDVKVLRDALKNVKGPLKNVRV